MKEEPELGEESDESEIDFFSDTGGYGFIQSEDEEEFFEVKTGMFTEDISEDQRREEYSLSDEDITAIGLPGPRATDIERP